MTTRPIFAVAGAVAAAGLLALAATAGHADDKTKLPDGPPPGGPMKPPAFADIDTNHDGSISQTEFDAFHAAHMPKGGHHHDGPPPGMRMDGHRGPPDFKTLDANGDGKVTLDEFEAPMKEHFTRLDTNHDGVLDASELEKGRPDGDGPPPPPQDAPPAK